VYDVCRQILSVRCCRTTQTHDRAPTRSSRIHWLSTLRRRAERIGDFVPIPGIDPCPARVVTRLVVMGRHHRELLNLWCDNCRVVWFDKRYMVCAGKLASGQLNLPHRKVVTFVIWHYLVSGFTVNYKYLDVDTCVAYRSRSFGSGRRASSTMLHYAIHPPLSNLLIPTPVRTPGR